MTIVLNQLKGGVIHLIKPSWFIDQLTANVKIIHQNLHLILIKVYNKRYLTEFLRENYSYYRICYYFLLLLILPFWLGHIKRKDYQNC